MTTEMIKAGYIMIIWLVYELLS